MAEFTPTPEQRDALAAPTPLLILAGAGTGKTTVVTHRIARLIASGDARPSEVLALTFADRAAAEMGERLAALLEERGLGEAGREVTCRTFHSFGSDMAREYGPLLGIDGDFRVLSTPEGWQLLSRVIDSLDFQAIELPMGGLGGFLNGLLGFFSTAKDHLVGPDELDAFVQAEFDRLPSLPAVAAEHWEERIVKLRDVAAAYRAYEVANRERGYLDYGDLLLLPVQLLRAHADVRESFHRRFRHLFVDEYQDTNYSQRTLLLDLLSPEARVVVIGDDDQSIYGWRGAVIRNILDFPREPLIAAAGPSERYLTINRRSGPPILDVANAVISQIDNRYPKKLGYVDGAPPADAGHYVAATDSSEARWIAESIERLHGSPQVQDPTGKKRGYGAFAVLCRKRSLFGPVARALEELGIPYELVGGSGFYGRWEIRDALSYLRVLADPADNLALARVLQSPSWRLSDRDLFHLSEWAQLHSRLARKRTGSPLPLGEGQGEGPTHHPSPITHHSPSDALPFRLIDAVSNFEQISGLSPAARTRLARLKALLDSLARALPQLSLARLVERVIEEAGYRRELSARPDFDSHLALLNLGKLVELARAFETGSDSLDGFVEYVQFALESGGEESEVLAVDEASDAVKVMTVHAAKGLEFPAVFVPGLAAKLFPDPRLDDPDRWDQFPSELKAGPSRGSAGEHPRLSPLPLGEGQGEGPADGVGADPRVRPLLDLPAIGNRKQLKAALDERKDLLRSEALDEERRLCYVALTRAQRALFLSRACWYGSNTRPRDPSPFWDEIIATGLSIPLGEEPDPGVNPNLQGGGGLKQASERAASLSGLLDPVRLSAQVDEVAAAHPERWSAAKSQADAAIFAVSTPLPLIQSDPPPVQLSCSGLLQYVRCPRLYRYLYLDRLPLRPAPWAHVGSEVHRLIEAMARAQPQPAPETDSREPDPDELETPRHRGRTPGIPDLLDAYRRSPFGRRPATRVEEPFALPLDGHLVRGRIDRLDYLPDGSWQLADFKASRFHGAVLPHQRLQMQLYALAAWRLWGADPDRLTCHLLFLVDGHHETLAFSAADLHLAEPWATEQLRQIQSGHFPPARSLNSCANCDYRHLCPPAENPLHIS
jgi:DNA helicase II / ATP-dependent DNA helicase PcrA